MNIKKIFNQIFKSVQPEYKPHCVSKRFSFGEPVEYEEKTYRYLYTMDDTDYVILDLDNGEEPRLFFINSGYITKKFKL